jgi:hypothetical protein
MARVSYGELQVLLVLGLGPGLLRQGSCFNVVPLAQNYCGQRMEGPHHAQPPSPTNASSASPIEQVG